MSGSVQDAKPAQPRQPTNLQGLLLYAMSATKAGEPSDNSDAAPMDEERRKFLEEALASMTVDMTEVMRGAINILSDVEKIGSIQSGAEVPSDVQKAFDTLVEVVEDVDIANDLYKLGGFTVFPVCFGSQNSSVRALTCKLLGDVCQNNPFCQEKAQECGLIKIALSLVQSETGNALARAIYALSCACRDFTPGCRVLVDGGGCEALVPLLESDGPAGTKAAFLVRYLCHNYPEAKERFIKQSIVKTIATAIKAGRTSTTEHLLSILLVLLENRPDALVKQCLEPQVGLKEVLEQHRAHEDLVEDDFLEEKEYVDQLLGILNKPRAEIDEVVDR